MKRGPILSSLLAAGIIAGFFYFFPVDIVGLSLLLLLLVTLLVVLVRRHLRPITSTRRSRRGRRGKSDQAATPRPESFSAKSDAQPPAAEEAEEEAEEGGAQDGAAFDTQAFSRFRSQLEAAEKEPVTAAPATPPPADESPPPPAPPPGRGGNVDQVDISAAARSKRGPAGKTQSQPKSTPPAKPQPRSPPQPDGAALQGGEEENEEDLFSDLRSDPLRGVKKEGAYGPGIGGKAAKGGKGAKGAKGAKAGRGAAAGVGRVDEVAEALEKSGEQPPGEESAILLKLTEEALGSRDLVGVQAGLEQLMALQGDKAERLPWNIRLIQARLAALEGDTAAALECYGQILTHGQELGEKALLEQIETLSGPMRGKAGAAFKVALLVKLLAMLRQANDRPAMDRVYTLIEETQQKAGDEQKLLQYYKNHLEIRKVLGDIEGQLALIDLIGNRYYKLGDTAAAKQFYEMGLKLRKEQETAADTPTKEAPTEPTAPKGAKKPGGE